MPLIASISGIRGTIGGDPKNNLTPEDILDYCNAFGKYIRTLPGGGNEIVVGRDARPSGLMVSRLVSGSLLAAGFDVVDLGLATTPTVEMAVKGRKAAGGIIITASHNPVEWNALKLLGPDGQFLDQEGGKAILDNLGQGTQYKAVSEIGSYKEDSTWLEKHIQKILDLDLVDAGAIRNADLMVAVDAVNSVGAIAVPALLEALGVREVKMINGTPDGHFAHDPEPLPANLAGLSDVCKEGMDLGIAVDPDVDRLAFVCEDGAFFGEEYTLVAVADYVLAHSPGNVVSNLSSTGALEEIAAKHACRRYTSAVGEVNVVKVMKEVNAVIGGEGNGGIIYPPIHYGRDALTGIALFLTHLVKSGVNASALRKKYPNRFITKQKVALSGDTDPGEILESLLPGLPGLKVDQRDGLWIDHGKEWVHLRKSNTEPIIRIYAESPEEEGARLLAEKYKEKIRSLMVNS